MKKSALGQFWACPKIIMQMTDLPLEARVIFGILWTRQNGENESWPGQEYLAREVGCSTRSVRRHIEALVKADLIQVHRLGLRKTNRYRFTTTVGNLILTGQFVRSRQDTGVLSRQDTGVLSHRKRTEEREQKNSKDSKNHSGDNSKRARPESIGEIIKSRTERSRETA